MPWFAFDLGKPDVEVFLPWFPSQAVAEEALLLARDLLTLHHRHGHAPTSASTRSTRTYD